MTDWSRGTYELTAERLEPAAEVAVAALAPRPDEHIADVGCGTGNAALVAAASGARVTGVDPANRLLGVARSRVPDAVFAEGDATALPFDVGELDGAVSVFGVIFAPLEAAAAELRRVVRPGGRIVFTTWTTSGGTAKVMGEVFELLGAPPRPVTWSDPDVVRAAFEGCETRTEQHVLTFDAPSVADYVREHVEHHPMWLDLLPALEARGVADEAMRRVTETWTEVNDDPSAFRTSSEYLVWRVTT